MSLFITSINSGSNGNCYYVGNSTEAVLVDVGISCKEVEQRLKQLNLSIQIVKAIFISHEHTDHIKGVSAFAKKYSLPVYITLKTRRKSIDFKDLIIAASALNNKIPLATINEKHFYNISSLQLITPLSYTS